MEIVARCDDIVVIVRIIFAERVAECWTNSPTIIDLEVVTNFKTDKGVVEDF